MRTGAGVLAAVVVSMGLMTTACGTSEAPDPKPNILGEYLRATNVKNDRFHSSESSEDRIANFAAYYTAEELKSTLLSAFPCSAGTASQKRSGGYFNTECQFNAAVRDAIRRVGGSEREVHGRVVVAKRKSGELELVTLFLAKGQLIDSNGETYGGLHDFREHNDLLSADDVILAPRNITAIPGEGEIVTVYGHTESPWPWWVVGGSGAFLVGVVILVVVRRRRLRSPWA